VFTEVQKTLSEALGNMDFDGSNLIGNRRQSYDYSEDEDEDVDEDEADENLENIRYMPTLPPIYPRITKKPYIPLKRRQVWKDNWKAFCLNNLIDSISLSHQDAVLDWLISVDNVLNIHKVTEGKKWRPEEKDGFLVRIVQKCIHFKIPISCSMQL